ncbi:MAG: hypothetical protein BAJALOKI3v1_760013 [Promethearchaeota archaeon]|nr:MAG: hypothetical protein BAJALOKI3v1_760013 [Candidatus Lokiarchaeota archaeon]
MLKLLQTRNLTESTNLIPTRYINRVEMEYNNYKYCIWDFGGALKYRKRYFDSCHYFAHTDEIMFFIDITDESSYNESLEYLTNLVEIFTAKYENLFPKDLKITILFHKIDPILLEKSKRVDRNIVWLEQKLSNIDFPCEYDIHLTSIYNFDKEHLSSLYEQELYECLSNVIIDAFSKNVLM